jgi:hypothetical protein
MSLTCFFAMKKFRRKRTRFDLLLVIIAAGAAALLSRIFWPCAPVTLEYSRNTTFWTEPRLPNGKIDYCAVLDKKTRRGVSAENNAAVLLIEAFGPSFLNAETRDQVLKELGVLPLPKGATFVDWNAFCESLQAEDEALAAEFERAQEAPWSAKEAPRVAKWLEVVHTSLARIEEASRKSRFYLPIVAASESADLTDALDDYRPTVAMRGAGHALRCRALLRCEQGNFNGVRQDLLAIVRLSSLMSQSNASLPCIIGRELWASVAETLAKIASTRRITPSKMKHLFQEVKALAPLPPLVDVVKMERLASLDSALGIVIEAQSGERAQNVPVASSCTFTKFDPNVYLHEINRLIDAVDEGLRQNSFAAGRRRVLQIREVWMKSVEDEARRLNTKWGKLRLIWMTPRQRRETKSRLQVTPIVGTTLKIVEHIVNAEACRFAWVSLCETSIALEEFHYNHGRYPENLEVLCPKYLIRIPPDSFCEAPIVYRREGAGYLLYSVGMDGVDNGGLSVGEDGEWFMRDLVLRGK